MRYLLILTFFIIFSTTAIAETTNIIAADLPNYSKVYSEKRDPFKDAAAAIALANNSQRNVLIEIGGNWCTWCNKMDAFLEKNPEVYQALHSKFVLLKVNVSNTNENKAFMSGLPPVLGYPHMYVSTAAGKMILSKDTAQLQKNGQYNAKVWLKFLIKWQANSAQITDNIVAKQ
ncbi:MAG: thioredoxin family protein [Alteromonadaceae bacterium]|nr:thioredoxin family protein [Alteromonadaceae bacterium]